jgi:hypothetical protein
MSSLGSSQLCDLCKALPLKEALRDLSQALQSSKSGDDADQETPEQSWHDNLDAVSKSSSSCILCKLVMKGLREARLQLVDDTRFSGDWYETPKDLDDDILMISYYANSKLRLLFVARSFTQFERENSMSEGKNGVEEQAHAWVRVICGGVQCTSWSGYGNIDTELRVSSQEGIYTSRCFGSVFDKPLGETGVGLKIDRHVQQNPVSSEVFNQLRLWIAACESKHKRCKPVRSCTTFLPTRVLNLGASKSPVVYLHEPKPGEEHFAYAALSHCWGSSQSATTTLSNLEDRKNGIRINDLPPTFQNAITVTRGLGLRHIWIDSLCIIQDDAKDWQREAGSMASVYNEASITIGASNASANSQGFLHSRENVIAVHEKSGFYLSLLPRNNLRLSAFSDPVRLEPLGTRAWTLQERYLSQRMISFSKEQVFWECNEMIAAEDGDCFPRDGNRLTLMLKTAAIDLSISGISGRSPGDTRDTNYFDWYEMVKEYTTRHITKSSDRLPALSGLANYFCLSTGDVYLAGIWLKGLIEGLLWCKANAQTILTKPTDYRAPSWSWASVDGVLNFPVYHFYSRAAWKYVMGNFEFTATCTNWSLNNEGQGLAGALKDVWLEIKAPLLPISSVRYWDKEVIYQAAGTMMDPFRSAVCDKVFEAEIQYQGRSQRIWLDGCFDTSPSVGNVKLFVLLLARLPDAPSECEHYLDIRFGILLEELKEAAGFRRVGIIDGVVKTSKINLQAKFRGKTYLERMLFKQQPIEGDEEIPNLMGPDPFENLEKTVVTIF